MKLKTFKDIVPENWGCVNNCERYYDEIKAVAIKWVKSSIKKKGEMSEKEMAYWVEVGKISVMQEFHNITEEDLKTKDVRR